MDADIQITVGTVQTDWFSCQVCDSVTLHEFLDTQSLPHMPKFHRTVRSLSFRSAAFERLFRDRGMELVWGQALVWMVQFSRWK